MLLAHETPQTFPSPFRSSSSRTDQLLNVPTPKLCSWILLFPAASFFSSSYCSLCCRLSFQPRASALHTGPSITCLKTWRLHPFPPPATNTRRQLLHTPVSCSDLTSSTRMWLFSSCSPSLSHKFHLCFINSSMKSSRQHGCAAMFKDCRMGSWSTGQKNPAKWQICWRAPRNYPSKSSPL